MGREGTFVGEGHGRGFCDAFLEPEALGIVVSVTWGSRVDGTLTRQGLWAHSLGNRKPAGEGPGCSAQRLSCRGRLAGRGGVSVSWASRLRPCSK